MIRPTVFLKTTPQTTRVMVQTGSDCVLKAALTPSRWSRPDPRALPTLLEAMALWHQAQVHAVLCATDVDSWCRLGLVDPLHAGLATVHYSVEVREPARDRRRRHLDGLGSFADLRRLVARGLR